MARSTHMSAVICALLVAALAPCTAHAEQFWTTQALLADQFKSSQNVSYVRAKLNPGVRARIEVRLGRTLPKPEYTLFVAKSAERIDGYALFDEQVGQHEPISFATFFDAAGAITRVEVVAYREPYGEGIRAERFRKQFVGRNAKSRFRAGDDVDTISGATISSRSTCIAVERAVALIDAWLQKQAQPLAAADRDHARVLPPRRIDRPLACSSAPWHPRANSKYEEDYLVRARAPRGRSRARSTDQYASGAARATTNSGAPVNAQ